MGPAMTVQSFWMLFFFLLASAGACIRIGGLLEAAYPAKKYPYLYAGPILAIGGGGFLVMLIKLI